MEEKEKQTLNSQQQILQQLAGGVSLPLYFYFSWLMAVNFKWCIFFGSRFVNVRIDFFSVIIWRSGLDWAQRARQGGTLDFSSFGWLMILSQSVEPLVKKMSCNWVFVTVNNSCCLHRILSTTGSRWRQRWTHRHWLQKPDRHRYRTWEALAGCTTSDLILTVKTAVFLVLSRSSLSGWWWRFIE